MASSPFRQRWLAATVMGLVAAAGLTSPVLPSRHRAEVWLERRMLAWHGARWLESSGVIRQRTEVDCGPAALANLLLLSRRRVPPIDSIATLARTTSSGTTSGNLAAAADALGIPVDLTRIDPKRVSGVPTPFIAWIHGHFVVLAARLNSDVVVIDPMFGRYLYPIDRLARDWTGIALMPKPEVVLSELWHAPSLKPEHRHPAGVDAERRLLRLESSPIAGREAHHASLDR